VEGTGRRRLRRVDGVDGMSRSGWCEVKAWDSADVSEGRSVCWA